MEEALYGVASSQVKRVIYVFCNNISNMNRVSYVCRNIAQGKRGMDACCDNITKVNRVSHTTSHMKRASNVRCDKLQHRVAVFYRIDANALTLKRERTHLTMNPSFYLPNNDTLGLQITNILSELRGHHTWGKGQGMWKHLLHPLVTHF